MKRRSHLVTASLACLALSFPVAPVPAQAAASTKTFDRAFTRTLTKYVPTLDRCVRMRVKGRIKGTRKYSGRGGMTTDWWDVRVVRPQVRATILDYYPDSQGPGCLGEARVNKIIIKQEWKHKRCTVAIDSISVGFPWSIGAGFGCSDDDRVARRSSVDGAGTYATQFNSDTVIRYDHQWYTSRSAFVAQVRVSVRIHRKMGGGSRNDQVSGVARVSLPGT